MLHAIRTFRDSLARRPLRLSEFTALFQVLDARSLGELLDAADRDPPTAYERVPGLHDLRLLAFDPSRDAHDDHRDRNGSHVLVLACVHDGDTEDVVDGLVEHAGAELSRVLRHCHGFAENVDLADYLKAHRLRSGYLFRDIGPCDPLEQSEAATGDATRREIEGAFELEPRFESFYAQYPPNCDPALLRSEFLRTFAGSGFPLALTRFERAVPNEARWGRLASELMQRMQARASRQAGVEAVSRRRRAAHAKGHALLTASFEVAPDLPARYRVGVFGRPGQVYQAIVRPSNGSEHARADGARDARGLALGLELDDAVTPDLAVPQSTRHPRQDFVLFSHPTFFASDLPRFVTLVAIANSHWSRRVVPSVAFAASRRGLREGWALLRALSRRITHPLEPVFHSATAYQLGPDHVVKYSLEPADRSRFAESADLAGRGDANFLQAALEQSLSRAPLELHLYIHAFAADDFAHRPEALVDLVEDPTVDWRSRGAERVLVGRVRIDAQQPAGHSLAAAESATFNPWNALLVHRPLGSLNRARLRAYADSARYRQGEPVSRAATAAGEGSLPWGALAGPDSIDAAE